MNLIGMRVKDMAAMAGQSDSAARDWLSYQGYRVKDGVIRTAISPNEVEDEIAARIASAPRSAPCFRCGAARYCPCP